MYRIILLTLVILPSILCFEQRFRGVHPDKLKNYQNDIFICDDGKTKISIDQVNDDYCDCADGTDEPGTSACSNGEFYCYNHLSKPMILPSSRVDDGICDCCDGTDEPKGRCANTCVSFAVEKIKQMEEKIKIINRSLSKRDELVKEANFHRKQREEKIQLLEREHDDLILEKQFYEGILTQLKTAIDTDTEIDQEEHIKENGNANAFILQTKGKFRTFLLKLMKKEKKFDVSDVSKIPDSDSDSDFLYYTSHLRYGNKFKETEEALRDTNDKLTQVFDELEKLKKLDETFTGANHEFDSFLGEELNGSDGKFKYVIKPFDRVDQQMNSGGHLAKVGTFTKLETDYINGKVIMHFENGDRCGTDGPLRKCLMNFRCSDEHELKTVSETSLCVYEVEYFTPLACQMEQIKPLQKEIDEFKAALKDALHDEL
eukprot:TRINITY_DN2597_c1_g1_i2.p1 TRINITY_DN2597_c1_g1~~TRINITY_DN2597_c1_g1_i2.p1  ORF type:complete len:430 (-),score=142.23 TRINITY_DN2597_c1_g1_i2:22-1311(-)